MPPKPLGGPVLASNSNLDCRIFLAEWLDKPDNWFFPRAIVNRVWAHFMGRGYYGKAMVVCVDKMTAVRMYDKVQKYWKEHLAQLPHFSEPDALFSMS